jgi:hypothetical protein
MRWNEDVLRRAETVIVVVVIALILLDVNLHTLRHTALSRIIAAGIDDQRSWRCRGHSSTGAVYAPHGGPEGRCPRDFSGLEGAVLAQNARKTYQKVLVDGARIELATSALRTRRSPS